MSATVTRKRAIRRLLWEHRQTHPCSQCGESDPACLDFHHLRDKQFSFNRASRYPLEYVLAEIAKCAILCANCHRKLHAASGREVGREGAGEVKDHARAPDRPAVHDASALPCE